MFIFLATIGRKARFIGILAGLGLAGLPPGPIFVGKWAIYQFVASWLGVPLTAILAATAIYMFAIIATLLALRELTSPLKLRPADVFIVLALWRLFCFIYRMWWW